MLMRVNVTRAKRPGSKVEQVDHPSATFDAACAATAPTDSANTSGPARSNPLASLGSPQVRALDDNSAPIPGG